MIRAERSIEDAKLSAYIRCEVLEAVEEAIPIQREVKVTHKNQFKQVQKNNQNKNTKIRINIPRR